jgi:hypothetical protein
MPWWQRPLALIRGLTLLCGVAGLAKEAGESLDSLDEPPNPWKAKLSLAQDYR